MHLVDARAVLCIAALGCRAPPGRVRMSASEDADLMQSLRQRKQNLVQPTIRPSSIRPDGLRVAGMRYADAGLASSTGPVFDADDLPEGEILTPGQAIRGLAAFNARDPVCRFRQMTAS